MTRGIGDGFSTYADSTLMVLNKKELIRTIRTLESNLRSAKEINDRQFEMLMARKEEKMKIFISMPMNGRTDEHIANERKRIMGVFPGAEFIDSYKPEFAELDPVEALGESIKLMAGADLVVGPANSETRGCAIERAVADLYDIPYTSIAMYPLGF